MSSNISEKKSDITKILTFKCDGMILAAQVKYVNEIIVSDTFVTRVPKVEDYISGVMNLRGKIIPVISLRLLLGREQIADIKDKDCVIILEHQEEMIGLQVDHVLQICDIQSSDICDNPKSQDQCKYVNGIIDLDGDTTFMLNSEIFFE